LLGPNGPHFWQGVAFDHVKRGIKPPEAERANPGVGGMNDGLLF
jgi:hypothetical protein